MTPSDILSLLILAAVALWFLWPKVEKWWAKPYYQFGDESLRIIQKYSGATWEAYRGDRCVQLFAHPSDAMNWYNKQRAEEKPSE